MQMINSYNADNRINVSMLLLSITCSSLLRAVLFKLFSLVAHQKFFENAHVGTIPTTVADPETRVDFLNQSYRQK